MSWWGPRKAAAKLEELWKDFGWFKMAAGAGSSFKVRVGFASVPNPGLGFPSFLLRSHQHSHEIRSVLDGDGSPSTVVHEDGGVLPSLQGGERERGIEGTFQRKKREKSHFSSRNSAQQPFRGSWDLIWLSGRNLVYFYIFFNIF